VSIAAVTVSSCFHEQRCRSLIQQLLEKHDCYIANQKPPHNQPLPATGITLFSAAGGVSSAVILKASLLFRQHHLVETRPFKIKTFQATLLTAALLKPLVGQQPKCHSYTRRYEYTNNCYILCR
jgi:hypothetical protein